MGSKPDVTAGVAALSDLSRDELVDRWRKIYGAAPPKGIRQDLMIRAVAWHVQAKHLGGLSAETRRLLRSAISRVEAELLARNKNGGISVDGDAKATSAVPLSSDEGSSPHVTPPPRQRSRLSPGSRLMREWGGKTHVVDVVEGGYVFEATVYPSLTAIAGKITGAHWSGPRFFGV